VTDGTRMNREGWEGVVEWNAVCVAENDLVEDSKLRLVEDECDPQLFLRKGPKLRFQATRL
jgi:hypothetical protein